MAAAPRFSSLISLNDSGTTTPESAAVDSSSGSRCGLFYLSPDRRLQLGDLLQPQFGLFQDSASSTTDADEPQMTAFSVFAGDVAALADNWTSASTPVKIHGTGAGIDVGACRVAALAEGVERYSAARYQTVEIMKAAANDLSAPMLDLDAIPRSSARELLHPRCPLKLADKRLPIRWVKAVSLHDGELVWVPLVMAFMHVHPVLPSEQFWLQISTGCAAYTSYEQALVRAIYEVVERDAISLLWHQRLPLPRINLDGMSPELALLLARVAKQPQNVLYEFYDATTDLGIPTVYARQTARHNPDLRTLVSCSTASSLDEAVQKVICDMGALRIAFRKNRTIPSSLDGFNDMAHGATYMARAEMESQFGFLSSSSRHTALTLSPRCTGDNSAAQLRGVLNVLKSHHMDAYAVDLTTDEARRAGLVVVRVLIPGLQPLSFNQLAQFRGHPRLYDAPRAMGHTSHVEEELNPFPQPFM